MREFRDPFRAVASIFASGKGQVSTKPLPALKDAPASVTKDGDAEGPTAKKLRRAIGTGSRRTLLTTGFNTIADVRSKRKSLLGVS